MFDLDAEQKVAYGSKLKNLQVQTSTYGRTVPVIYGTAGVAGNIILAQPIKEEAITTRNEIGRSINVAHNYYAALAIVICKGEVEKLKGI
ncbi:hypothetical protein [Wolbachia pipientis]|uniref:hypothetical protein n=1 Tax=Wolbachia pipientis TaxID=955 RepID=UPI0025A420AB|nr:hypothetical protein [Wolbachia pipientis]MDM8335636.1 hypothetical protein [Wolbachia pipientis]